MAVGHGAGWLGGRCVSGTGSNGFPDAQDRRAALRWGEASDDARVGLTDALAAIGYVDKQSISIEWRFATSRDVARHHARELAGMQLDLIVTSATPAAVAMKALAGTTPIVLAGAADPVGAGLVLSLARPGGNVIGVSANLPVEEPTSYVLIINMATAKAMGVMVPRSLLLRADRVVQ